MTLSIRVIQDADRRPDSMDLLESQRSSNSKPDCITAAPSVPALSPGIDEDAAHLSTMRARAEAV
ncbi:hypothetical protein [Streptomyces sp. NPDC002685]|uniref:hypothetical protein n=1 Tax=Streptomyces sp. NPDC002685 TaxID=3154540 RepID=UPI00332F3EDE